VRYIIFSALICICTFGAIAQNTYSGTIKNINTNEPLLATVYFPQLEKGTVADLDGNYIISNIPEGSYTVVFSLLGYATVSKKVYFSENETIIENIALTESAVEIEEVIISTPFHKLQSDNVMKVERVSTNDLSSQGAMTLSNGITNIAGVESISTGIGIGKPVIRGLSSNRVLTYTQGVRLENQQFGDEHGLGVNEAGIESVEVIKGPASLLYGSDALGGVLYLNPEKFAPSNTIHADAGSTYFSNTFGTSSNIGVQASGKKLKFIARGAFVTHSDYETGEDYRVTNSRFNETDFKSGLRFQNSKLKSTLRYNYTRTNVGITEVIGEQTTSKAMMAPYQKIDNHIISLDNTYFFNNSSLVIKGGYLFNNRREFEEIEANALRTSDESPAALQLKLNTFNYDVQYNLPDLGNFETIVGVQGMYQTNKNFGEEILIPDAKTRDVGVLATTHYHLEKIDLQAGLRFDNRSIQSEAARSSTDPGYIAPLDKNFNSFNAAIGAKVAVIKNLQARVNLASGFRAPNLAELTSNGVHEGTNRYEIGNPNLTNEQNLQTDLSLEYNNEHFEVSANGFYNKISNYIYITPTGEIIEDNFVYDYIQDDASLYGGELGVHIHPHPLDWLHLESSFETVTGKLKDDSYLPLIPANSLTNTLRIEFNKGKLLNDSYTFISLKNVFNQNNISSFETPTNSYNLLNFGGGTSFEFNKTTLSLGINVTNLTNESYISHLSRLKQENIANIGRSINLNMKLLL
jgi:iron complex outermembrane receptor protein